MGGYVNHWAETGLTNEHGGMWIFRAERALEKLRVEEEQSKAN